MSAADGVPVDSAISKALIIAARDQARRDHRAWPVTLSSLNTSGASVSSWRKTDLCGPQRSLFCQSPAIWTGLPTVILGFPKRRGGFDRARARRCRIEHGVELDGRSGRWLTLTARRSAS